MSASLTDTVKRAVGKERVVPTSASIREWGEVEVAYCYGDAARKQFGARYPQWNERLEVRLKSEWAAGHALIRRDWKEVSSLVRHGYEYEQGASSQ